MIKQFESMVEKFNENLKKTFENIHQGYPTENLVRFLKARDGNVSKAYEMLIDCLNWRIENKIDDILAKPIIPVEFYRLIRDSQLVGMSGYSKDGYPVFAVGAGFSTSDKTSMDYYVLSHIQINEYRDRVILPCAMKRLGRYVGTCIVIFDMTGLKLSSIYQIIKKYSEMSTINELNYPERTETYFIVNAPYMFSICWKVLNPLMFERTRKKVKILSGSGRDELLKIMDYESLPHFCRKEWPGSSRHPTHGTDGNCFSLAHTFHKEMYNYIKEQEKRLGELPWG